MESKEKKNGIYRILRVGYIRFVSLVFVDIVVVIFFLINTIRK